MKSNILIHVPHSSIYLPDEFYKRSILSKEKIEKENIFISDYLIDTFIPENVNIIKFEYSRMFCDVERFKEGEKEIMSKYGMGVIYEKDHNGNNFIILDDKYKENIIKNIYDKHHKLLDDKVTDILKTHSKAYIIDLHSFSEKFVKKVLNKGKCPDICVGYDDGYCNINLINMIVNHFKSYGYTVKINYPYSGSIIPNKYFKENNTSINSFMIEINKNLYLDNNVKLNNKKYNSLKSCMDDFYKILNNYISNENISD